MKFFISTWNIICHIEIPTYMRLSRSSWLWKKNGYYQYINKLNIFICLFRSTIQWKFVRRTTFSYSQCKKRKTNETIEVKYLNARAKRMVELNNSKTVNFKIN